MQCFRKSTTTAHTLSIKQLYLFRWDLSQSGTENSKFLSQPVTGSQQMIIEFEGQRPENLTVFTISMIPRSWSIDHKYQVTNN